MLTFVCDQCGATGSVRAPGSARCTACGHVALVKAPAGWDWSTPQPDPFAAPTPESARKAHGTGQEAVAPKERRATLWVRPGPEETPTTEPYPIAVTPRPRSFSRIAIAIILLSGSAAVAFAAAVAVGPRWLDRLAGNTGAPPPAPEMPAPPSVPPAASTERSASANAGKVRAAPVKRAVATAGQTAALKGALVNPAPVDRRCVPRALRARPDLAGRLPGEIAVRFRVTASGDVARIDVPEMSDRDLADAIADAVRSCRFMPGTDENGRPVALPIVMRIRFAAPAEATSGF